MALAMRPEKPGTDYDIRVITYDSPEYWQTLKLREQVLRRPLGLEFSEHDIRSDKDYIHLSVWSGGKLTGCCILIPESEKSWRIRQVAVVPELKGRGIGTRLMLAAEMSAENRGIPKVYLHARHDVIEFYLKLGYTPVGGLFNEVGLPHLRMEKKLDS